jgi:hypothetical protein
VDQSWKTAQVAVAASHVKLLSRNLGEISVQVLQEIWAQLMSQESTHLSERESTDSIPYEGWCKVERGHESTPKSRIPWHR